MSNLLVDPAEVAALVGAETSDELVRVACIRASARFEASIGYPLGYQESAMLHLTPRRYRTLFSPIAPLWEIHSLTDRVSGADLAYVYFDVETGAIVPDCESDWPYGFKTVEMVASVGYHDIPEDVADAVAEQAVALFSAPNPSVQQISQGSRSLSFSARGALGVTQRWSDAVARYSRGVSD